MLMAEGHQHLSTLPGFARQLVSTPASQACQHAPALRASAFQHFSFFGR
jgi:hypothetical protein